VGESRGEDREPEDGLEEVRRPRLPEGAKERDGRAGAGEHGEDGHQEEGQA
jgi:hypothetical protein